MHLHITGKLSIYTNTRIERVPISILAVALRVN